MQQRTILKRMLGIALLAMLFGGTSVHAQSGSTSGSSTQEMGGSAQSGTSGAQSGASGAQSGTSGATGTTTGTAAAGKALSKSDESIMRELAQANLGEIEAGKIALSQSKNDQVRNFAQRMIDDHTQAQKDLEQLAQSKGVTLPTEPGSKHQKDAKKLSALEGDKFDKQYLSQGGLRDHRETHKLLQNAQKRATDPELKELVTKMEPIINQHLTMAQDVSSGKAGASGSMGPAGTSSSGAAGGATGESGMPGASGTSGKPDTSSGASGTSGSSNSVSPGK